ncbi:MAG: bifunctional 4-hydroxy-2-oxoglutarate aldolase/2-dehydro-3-deoxy-phosphogluconate aldolase [Chloroflexota bacterium]
MNTIVTPEVGGLSAALRRVGVVPVVTVSRPEQAIPLAEALRLGGLSCVEITFRSDAAVAAIEMLRSQAPDMLVGAGTVLTIAQAEAAIAAGATFIVAPGFNPAVVEHVLRRGIPMLPGVCTPTEIEAALARDIRIVKFFPAGAMGGVGFLRALAGPYPMVSYVPTGGVTTENLADYLALSSVAAVGGTWLAKPNVVAAGDWKEVERLAAEAAAIVRRARGGDGGPVVVATGDDAGSRRPA